MQHVALDDLDRAILVALQADGRMSNLDLSRTVGLSAAATHARVRRLESSGVIRGYAALVDPRLPGSTSCASSASACSFTRRRTSIARGTR